MLLLMCIHFNMQLSFRLFSKNRRHFYTSSANGSHMGKHVETHTHTLIILESVEKPQVFKCRKSWFYKILIWSTLGRQSWANSISAQELLQRAVALRCGEGTAAVVTCDAPLVLRPTALHPDCLPVRKTSKYKQDSKSRFHFPLVSKYGNLRALRHTL